MSNQTVIKKVSEAQRRKKLHEEENIHQNFLEKELKLRNFSVDVILLSVEERVNQINKHNKIWRLCTI